MIVFVLQNQWPLLLLCFNFTYFDRHFGLPNINFGRVWTFFFQWTLLFSISTSVVIFLNFGQPNINFSHCYTMFLASTFVLYFTFGCTPFNFDRLNVNFGRDLTVFPVIRSVKSFIFVVLWLCFNSIRSIDLVTVII